jgi:tellurite resistance-related uncharacterized protein
LIHKEDGIDEVVDTHGKLLNVFFWFLLTHNEIKPDEDKTMNINNNAIVQPPQEAHNVQSLSSSEVIINLSI